MSVIDGFDLNNFNFMEWDYLAIYEVKVINPEMYLLASIILIFSGYFLAWEQRDRVDPELLAHRDKLNRIPLSHSVLCGKKMPFNIFLSRLVLKIACRNHFPSVWSRTV